MTRKEICDKARMVKNANLKLTFWERFWARVDKTETCWNWTGTLNGDGYGQVKRDGRAPMCHRLVFELTFGEIPGNLQVCHHCDNPSCVRPSHLFLGTAQDNMDDSIRKGRRRYRRGRVPKRQGEKNGRAKLTDDMVRRIRSADLSAWGSSTKLAKNMGISYTQLRFIILRKNWSHI